MQAYLTRLGVSDQEQLQHPTEKLPSAFNPALQEYWQRIVSTCHETDVEKCWDTCIHELFNNAVHSNIYPFTFNQSQVNEDILKQLVDARNSLAKFINANPLFIQEIQYKTARVDVVFIDSTFTIKKVFENLRDKEILLSYLEELQFETNPVLQLVFTKNLSDKVKLVLDLNRNEFFYEISVNQIPIISDCCCPSNQELKEFILDVMYKVAKSLSEKHCCKDF